MPLLPRRIKIVPPFVVEAGANVMRVTVDATTYSVTIDAQTWYMLSTLPSGDYPGFLGGVVFELNAATGETFQIEACTPSASPQQTFCGLRIYSTTASAFSLDFSDAAWTLPPELLGFAPDQSTDVTASTYAHPTSGDVPAVQAPYTYARVWRSWSHYGHRGAMDERSYPEALRRHSSPRARRRITRTWHEDLTRTLEFDEVHAAHVHGMRAADARYAQVAGLGPGDVNNSFRDVWQLMARDLAPSVVCYYDAGQMNAGYSTAFDYARIKDPAQMSDLRKVISTRRPNGERYRIQLTLDVEATSYDY